MLPYFRSPECFTKCLIALVAAGAVHNVDAEVCPIPEGEACVSRLDDLWNGGDRRAYYREVIRLAKEIEAMPPSRLRIGIAANLLENLLSRDGLAPEACNGDLPAMRVCAMALLFNTHPAMNDGREHARILSRFLEGYGKRRSRTTHQDRPTATLSRRKVKAFGSRAWPLLKLRIRSNAHSTKMPFGRTRRTC